MTKIRIALTLTAAAACLSLAACGDKKAPSGQVVARIEKDEITAIDLRNELGNFAAPNPQVRKAAEQQALDAILTRRVLAAAAEKAGVGKTPEFAQQEQRMKETLLVQSWQNQIAKSVPAPSKEESDRFIAEHPDLYAQHKVFDLEQLQFARPNNPEVIKAFAPLKTLEQVQALLAANNVRSRAENVTVDSLSIDPRIAAQIVALPPGEVFIVPNQNILTANRVREMRVVPLPADIPMKHASAYLKSQHTREAVQRQLGATIEAAKSKITYSKAYQPAAPKPAAKVAPPAAPAAAAPPPKQP